MFPFEEVGVRWSSILAFYPPPPIFFSKNLVRSSSDGCVSSWILLVASRQTNQGI